MLQLIDAAPSVRVLVVVPVELNVAVTDTVTPFTFRVPALCVIPVQVTLPENIQLPAVENVRPPHVFPFVVTVCCVADVETKLISEETPPDMVYVIPDANLKAMLLVPAVASPTLKVTDALCVSVLV